MYVCMYIQVGLNTNLERCAHFLSKLRQQVRTALQVKPEKLTRTQKKRGKKYKKEKGKKCLRSRGADSKCAQCSKSSQINSRVPSGFTSAAHTSQLTLFHPTCIPRGKKIKIKNSRIASGFTSPALLLHPTCIRSRLRPHTLVA